ncbi:MAG: undecaprenyldiphospho-muramoylpentapeptide beta-N-acetylglucosaminyltransferase [Gammaproteobacteria bacterium]|nr:undecaprenyldiphospho-muramoylpentapeptide beta-N-acetylglucosaminyltransferase [Gammaproteobacteria bacterium]
MSHKRILIMAGGTGGHVYPALAVAKYLRERDAEILWLGTERGLESRIVPDNAIAFSTIKITGLRGKGILRVVLAPFKLLIALVQSMILMANFKPDAVLGMGGYVSGPGGVAACLLRIPLYIHEQNAIAGLTNRLLAPFATYIMQGFPDTFDKEGKVETTGNPVRKEIIDFSRLNKQEDNYETDNICLLVLGGSLGARALNQTLPAAVEKISKETGLNIWHQTGDIHLSATRKQYKDLGIDEVKVEAFIEDMAGAYAWADLVLCRAGALTLAEICVCGIASVLVPYPYAVDDHQTANARLLSEHDAAILLPESDLAVEKLKALLTGLCQARAQIKAMAAKTRHFAYLDATEKVGNICLEGAHA